MAKQVRYTFYRPHARVQYTGKLINHKTGEVFKPPARTKQQFLEQCDINTIVKQFTKAGMLDQLMRVQATGALQVLPDSLEFQEALNLVIQAERTFADLPSKLRNRFENDPSQFLQFMQDPANQDEMIKLGLATDNRPPPEPKISSPDPTGGDGGKPPSGGAKAP